MKIVTINAYSFDELKEDVQQKIIERWETFNDYWHESVYEDAEIIGLKIKEFDIDTCSIVADVLTSSPEIAESIVYGENRHGENTDTYKLAKQFLLDLENTDETDETNIEQLHETFDAELKQAYLQMLRSEYEYQNSFEAIKETIKANEYLFSFNGVMIPITTYYKDNKIIKYEFDGEICQISDPIKPQNNELL